MKLRLLLLSLILAATSCGKNLHLVSKNGIERNAPGLGTDPVGTTGGSQGGTGGSSTGGTSGGGTGGTVSMKVFTGSAVDGANGIQTSGFASSVDMSHAENVDFSGLVASDNSFLRSPVSSYSLRVQREKITKPDQRTTLTDFFGSETLKYKILNPVRQDFTIGRDSGVVAARAKKRNHKVAFVIEFKEPISFFGGTFVDVESTEKVPAIVRVYDKDKKLLHEEKVIYPNSETGNREIHFIGFKSDLPGIHYLSLTVGDLPRKWSLIKRDGRWRGMAIDDFLFGR
jgi:hypothetical protein